MDPASMHLSTPSPELGQALDALKNRDFSQAHRRLLEMADRGQTDAMGYLGMLYLHGLGIPYDPTQAYHWTEQAAREGNGTALLALANLVYLGLGTLRDPERAKAVLLAAARTGNSAALRTLGLVYLGLGANWHQAAITCFEAAATLRDVFATHALSVIRLGLGQIDLALPILSWAGTQGLFPSLLRLKNLQHQLGISTVRDLAILPPQYPDRPHLRTIIPFEWETRSAGSTTECDTRIALRIGTDLLHPIECDYLIALAAPHLRPAETQEPHTGRIIKNPVRTSSAMNFPPNLEDLILMRLEERIASFAGQHLERAEALAVLRYRPGEEYRPHYDAFDPETCKRDPECIRLGQRTETVLTYLNDGFTGGATDFPTLQQTIESRSGQVVAFRNLDASGNRMPLALHAGLPVQSGEKWLATLWFRERPGARSMG